MDYNTDDFKMFLQLDDVQGNFKDYATEELQRIEQREQEQAQFDSQLNDDEEELEHIDEGLNFDDFDFDNLKFEGEEGFTSKATNPNRETEEAEQDDDNFIEDESEEATTEEAPEQAQEDAQQYDDGEAVDVDFDTVLTLPDGRQATIEELANSHLDEQRFIQREREIAQKEEQLQKRLSTLQQDLDLSFLEVDRELAEFASIDWMEYGARDPNGYTQHSLYLKQLEQKKQALIEAQAKLNAQKEAEKATKRATEAQAAITVLKSTIPQWSEDYYQKLMEYAVSDLGFSEDSIVDEIRAPVFLAISKAYEISKGKESIKAKLLKAGSPKNLMSSGSANTKAQTQEHINKAKIAKAWNSGKMDHADVFKFLED